MKNLKRYRKAAGLTLSELAARSGVAVATIHRIENGEREGSKETTRLLSRELRVALESNAKECVSAMEDLLEAHQ